MLASGCYWNKTRGSCKRHMFFITGHDMATQAGPLVMTRFGKVQIRPFLYFVEARPGRLATVCFSPPWP